MDRRSHSTALQVGAAFRQMPREVEEGRVLSAFGDWPVLHELVMDVCPTPRSHAGRYRRRVNGDRGDRTRSRPAARIYLALLLLQTRSVTYRRTIHVGTTDNEGSFRCCSPFLSFPPLRSVPPPDDPTFEAFHHPAQVRIVNAGPSRRTCDHQIHIIGERAEDVLCVVDCILLARSESVALRVDGVGCNVSPVEAFLLRGLPLVARASRSGRPRRATQRELIRRCVARCACSIQGRIVCDLRE